MPTNSRKRRARAGSDIQSPAKRTRVGKIIAQTDEEEATTRAANDEQDGTVGPEAKQNPTLRKSRKANATTTSTTEATGGDPTDTRTKKTVKSKSTKTKTFESDPERAATPKISGKPIETKSVKLEDANEDHLEVKGETPQKKTRKRKITKQEETGEPGEHIKGEEASPQKPKRKRKTQEEKDAEAMPLAARTIGLRMFIGAHVSGAKGIKLYNFHPGTTNNSPRPAAIARIASALK
ncbi:MAG: hypothetical protein Q9188_007533 [Gyalolechia gomerana]